MLKKIFIILASILPFSIVAKPILPIEHWKTSNGVPVYFVQRSEVPMLDIRVIFKAGSAYDGRQWGLANLTNAMLNEGTSHLNADQIAAKFDALGAGLDLQASRDMAWVGLRTMTEEKYRDPALALFAELISAPTFPEKSLVTVKQQIVGAIHSGEQDPATIASLALFKALYKHHPYGNPVLGNSDTVNAIKRQDIEDFYHQYYVMHNASIVIVGDISQESAKKMAEQIIRGLPAGNPALSTDSAPLNHAQSVVIPYSSQQKTVLMGQVGIGYNNPDFYPLLVGNTVLGGNSMTSVLFNQIRNLRGLVYGVTSNFYELGARGPFIISLQTRAAKAKEALSLTQQELKNFIEKGPTDDELRVAQQYLVGSFPLEIAENSQIIDKLTDMIFYQMPLDYWDHYQERVNQVTKADIKKAFSRWVKCQNFVVVIVGPGSS